MSQVKGRVEKPIPASNAKSTSRSLKGLEEKRKQVYKPILDNPYIRSQHWPFVERDIGLDILELLCRILSPVGNYKKLRKLKSEMQLEEPEIGPFLTLGFNSTNKKLEEMSKFNRKVIKKQCDIPLSIVFVCKQDIKPDLLTKHLPLLVQMGSTEEKTIKLVQLPRGSMARISESLDSNNTGIVGISGGAPGINLLENLVADNVKDVEVEWAKNLSFQTPNIKLLVTTQPVTTSKNKKTKGKKATNN